jgi:hypothetical protein
MEINNQRRDRQIGFSRSSLAGLFLLFHTLVFAGIPDKRAVEAKKAKLLGGASKVIDKSASRGQLVSLAKRGQGLKIDKLTEAGKLDICYASVNVGAISVAVNNQKIIKVYVHSSEACIGSFLHAIIDIAIPKGAKLDICLDSSDVALNFYQIMIGIGDLVLSPDIWNLPKLPFTDGRDVAVINRAIKYDESRVTPLVNNLFNFTIEGPGKIIGAGNGNPIRFEPDNASQCIAFNGYCLILAHSEKQDG